MFEPYDDNFDLWEYLPGALALAAALLAAVGALAFTAGYLIYTYL